MIYTYVFVAKNEESPMPYPASLLISYIGVRSSGVPQVVSYTLISISRMVLVLSPAVFQNLNTAFWATTTYICVAVVFIIDFSLALLLNNPSKCETNKSGIKLHQPFFAYSEIETRSFFTNFDIGNQTQFAQPDFENETLSAYSEAENQTIVSICNMQNNTEFPDFSNETMFDCLETPAFQPCSVFPIVSLSLGLHFIFEVVRVVAAIVRHIKKIPKDKKKISFKPKFFRKQIHPTLPPVQFPMETMRRGARTGSMPNNSLQSDGTRIFSMAQHKKIIVRKEIPRKETNYSIKSFLKKLLFRNVL